MQILRKCALLLFLASCAFASSHETFVTPVSYGAAGGFFSSPVIATDGQTFLAAWIQNSGTRLLVQRLDEVSESSVPRTIASGHSLAHGSLDLAWTGSNYLLAYTNDTEIRTVRLDRSGRAVPNSERVLARGFLEVALASRSDASMILAKGISSRNEIIAFTLDLNDRITREDRVLNHTFARIDVEATKTGFFILISGYPGLSFIRTDATGLRLDPERVVIMPTGGTSSTAYTPQQARVIQAPNGMLVVWTARSYAGPSDLFSVMIDGSGTLSPVVPLPHSSRYIWALDVVRTGTGYRVLLTGGEGNLDGASGDVDFELLTLDEAGRANAPSRRFGPTAAIERLVKLVKSAEAYGVIWLSHLTSSGSGARLLGFHGPELTLDEPPLLLSRKVVDQFGADVASDGTRYLVAWLEQDLDRQRIVAVIVDADGRVIGEPLVIRDGPFSYLTAPKVTYGHGMYLVTWVAGGVWCQRVSSSGMLIDAEPIRINGNSDSTEEFDATVSPEGFLVVWAASSGIMGAELRLTGPTSPRPLTVPLPVQPGNGGRESDPKIAFNGSTYLLAYTFTESPPCIFPNCSSTSRQALARLDASGFRSGESQVFEGGHIVDVVPGAGTFALLQFGVFSVIDGNSLRVLGRVSYDGAPNQAAVVWNGSAFRLIFASATAGGSPRLYHQRVRNDGNAEAPTVIGWMSTSAQFRIGATAADRLLAAYSVRLPQLPYDGAERVVVQTLDGTSQPLPIRRRGIR